MKLQISPEVFDPLRSLPTTPLLCSTHEQLLFLCIFIGLLSLEILFKEPNVSMGQDAPRKVQAVISGVALSDQSLQHHRRERG